MKVSKISIDIINPILREISQVVLIALITLKSLDYIDWSWWLVFSPILVSVFLGAIINALIIKLLNKNDKSF